MHAHARPVPDDVAELKRLVAAKDAELVAKIGESVTEVLEYIPGRFEVVLGNGRTLKVDESIDPVALARLVDALDGGNP